MIGYFKTVKAGIQGDSGVQRIINKKEIIIGRFDNIEDAIAARKEAEEKYFGEYRYTG